MIRVVIKFYIYALITIAVFDLIARIPNETAAVMVGVVFLVCVPELIRAFAPLPEHQPADPKPRLLPSPTAAALCPPREQPVRLVRVHGP